VLDEAAGPSSFDEPNFAAGYALTAIPARFALERRRWLDAGRLEVSQAKLPWENFGYATAITYFARALGSASGRPGGAGAGGHRPSRRAAGGLVRTRFQTVLTGQPGGIDAESCGCMARLFGRTQRGSPEPSSRAAADLDDKTGKHPVTPGSGPSAA
jgi:hypothetical protein